MVIWPEASSAQNSIAAVSAEGSAVWVLIRRLNSSCRRSIAFVVLADFHWLGGRRVKANRRSPASSRLSATARCLSRHLRMKALRRGPVFSPGVAENNFLLVAGVFSCGGPGGGARKILCFWARERRGRPP